MPSIEFSYDFGSPNAYLAHKVIPAIESRLGTQVLYVPALLGGIYKATGNASPMVTMVGIKNKGEYANLETRRFVEKHQLEDAFQFNPNFPVNTLLMMRIAVAARASSSLYRQVIECFFDAMWLQQKKMDDPEVVADALVAAGLHANDLMDAASLPEHKQALIELTESAVARGAFGSPSFFVEEALFFGKDKLRDVEEEYLKREASV